MIVYLPTALNSSRLRSAFALDRVLPWLSPVVASLALVGVGLRPSSAADPAAPTTDSHRSAPHEGLALGMNLSAVNDWDREWVFVDVFKQSRPWISQNVGGQGPWDNGQVVLVDALGWPKLRPGQAATTLLCRDLQGHYPAGIYVCTYEGRGDLQWGFDARLLSATAGRMLLDVKPSDSGILLRIDRSEPSNPIRNIRVLMPGFERLPNSLHPLFVQRLKPFRVLRFMDWTATNNSPIKTWSERTKPEFAQQSGPKGVAIEYAIDLCNQLHADPWFCMPHLADDDFVRHFAELVREKLHPEGRVHVEWSNEAWNSIFQQNGWVQAEAKTRGCRWTWVIADEARRDWQIWRDVFRDRPDRVVRVVAGQHYNPWVCQDIADRLDGEFDAIACGAYFFPQLEDEAKFDAQTTPSAVLASCRANIDGPGAANWKQHATLAATWSQRSKRRIPLMAYEGGQHLTTFGKMLPYTPVYEQVQSQPEMGALYGHLLEVLRREKFDLLVAFNYAGRSSVFGSWGHLRYQDEPLEQAPKFRALWNAAGASP
jgi:hypothetical protein